MPATITATTTAEEAAAAFASQIRGKTVLTTGVSPGGLGAYFVETIAKFQPKLLILAGRDITKVVATEKAIASIAPGVKTRVLELDLASQVQIRKAAAEVNAYEESIDVLVNNAAIMACPYATTPDGLESQFGTNHIGHFLFTNLIIGKVLAAGPGARIINVSSDGHRLSPIRFDDVGFSEGKTYHKWRAYGQAKTANILFSVALAEKLRLKGLLSFSLHPGVIQTNIGRTMSDADIESLKALDAELGNSHWQKGFTFVNISVGTTTHVVASFDPSIVEHNGAYLAAATIAPPEDYEEYAVNKENAERLWKISEKIVGETFVY